MSAHVIALANLKGGCGKTTLSINLASGLARRAEVGLIDADPQGALRHWSGWGEAKSGLPRLFDDHDDAHRNLEHAREHCEYVIVDCPPSLDMNVTIALLEHSHQVLIPVLPSPLDLWASADTVEAVNKARENGNSELSAYLLLNQTEPRSAMTRAMQNAVSGLGLPVLPSAVRRRAAFRTAVVEGVSVYQLGGRGRAAVDEIENIIDEVTPS